MYGIDWVQAIASHFAPALPPLTLVVEQFVALKVHMLSEIRTGKFTAYNPLGTLAQPQVKELVKVCGTAPAGHTSGFRNQQ